MFTKLTFGVLFCRPLPNEMHDLCSEEEERLLDAAHIIADTDDRGEPAISNGLILCTIHHRAYDNHLVGISPDYEVHVSRSLLDDDDGPMLELLKGFHRKPIRLPERRSWQPDRKHLAVHSDEFQDAA